MSVTRDYGASASDKSNELLLHMGIAIISVVILIWIALGRRESIVVLIAIPVTLALTLFMFYLYGCTLKHHPLRGTAGACIAVRCLVAVFVQSFRSPNRLAYG